MADNTALPKEFALVRELTLGDPSLTEQSQRRFAQILDRFFRFLINGYGLAVLQDVDSEIIESFVNAKLPDGSQAELATKHLRRATLRLLSRIAEQNGIVFDDPTRRVELPSRSFASFRPLTFDEVVLCRSFSVQTFSQSRQPSAWALAEATATTSELPNICIDDVDLENKRIWLHDGAKTFERWGELSDWGIRFIEKRIKELKRKDETHLVYSSDGNAESKQASACVAIRETIIRAGLGDEPGVRPASVVAWAGLTIYKESNSIEEVAKRLGFKSLDRAARFVGLNS